MDNDDLQECIEILDMEAYLDREGIEYRVTMGSRGTQLNVKECPVCGNSHYKVYIGAETGLGNCFAGDCQATFNKWSFIKNYLASASMRDVIEHIKTVAKEQGWRAPRRRALAVDLGNELVIPESIALPINGRNLRYLTNRGITPDIARYFHLRYCHKGFYRYKDQDGKARSQDYSNRIIIPIFDLAGDLVSFQGRDTTGTAERKYLFPPGFASTGAHLFNGQNAIGAKRIVIGEGVFDVAALKIALDEEMALRDVVPVGSFGKHLSSGTEESQMGKLMTLKSKGLESVTFMWDGEPKALDGAIDAALAVRKMGLKARVAILPKGKDPNEATRAQVRAAYYQAHLITTATAARLKIQAVPALA
jgi:DNA primase